MTDPTDRPKEERFDARVAEAYRRTAAPDASSRARLDDALARAGAPRRRRFTGGFSMAYAAAALLVVLAIGFGLGRMLAPKASSPPLAGPLPETSAGAEGRVVLFVLVAREPARVSLVGDFNGWDPEALPMVRRPGEDTWTVHVRVPPGRHLYAFVVDGSRWITDPQAPVSPDDDFGVRKSVLVVAEAFAS